MSARKTRLVDCNPQWMTSTDDERQRYLRFDCPEGHEGSLLCPAGCGKHGWIRGGKWVTE